MKIMLVTLPIIAMSLISCITSSIANDYNGKRILFINSYHEGYEWSDGIADGIKQGLEGSGVELKIVWMDTKKNPSEEFAKEAGIRAKAAILEFNPDVVIAADDAASKYVIMPYYKDADLPFIFCGVNWDGSVYGYPYKNTTGMVEVSPIDELVDLMRQFSKGPRVGYLAEDTLTDRRNASHFRNVFKVELVESYATDFNDWQRKYIELQKEADMLIIGNTAGLAGWNAEQAVAFVMEQARIPNGTDQVEWTPHSLIGYVKSPREQGMWSADAALKILDGTPPSSIPVTHNTEGNLVLNMKLAERMGIKIPYQLIGTAQHLIQ